MAAMTICNVASSSLVRESDFAFLTRAGVEIGVASTKAFTTQLTCLLLLTVAIGRLQGTVSEEQEHHIIQALQRLPTQVESCIDIRSRNREIIGRFHGEAPHLILRPW